MSDAGAWTDPEVQLAVWIMYVDRLIATQGVVEVKNAVPHGVSYDAALMAVINVMNATMDGAVAKARVADFTAEHVRELARVTGVSSDWTEIALQLKDKLVAQTPAMEDA